MSAPVISGTGRLRSVDNKEIGTIMYQLQEKPSTESGSGEWQGSFLLDQIIKSGEYIIELEDGRKGTGKVGLIGEGEFAMPGVFDYIFRGTSPLK